MARLFIDAFVIMPNHVHGIIFLTDGNAINFRGLRAGLTLIHGTVEAGFVICLNFPGEMASKPVFTSLIAALASCSWC